MSHLQNLGFFRHVAHELKEAAKEEILKKLA